MRAMAAPEALPSHTVQLRHVHLRHGPRCQVLEPLWWPAELDP